MDQPDAPDQPDPKLPRTNIKALRVVLDVEPGETYRVVIDSVSTRPEIERSALVQVRATDVNNIRVPLIQWPTHSARVNEYVYLKDGDENSPATTDFRVTIPEAAVQLELVGHHWRANALTTVLGDPLIYKIDAKTPLPMKSPAGANLHWVGSEFHLDTPIPSHASNLEAFIYTTAETAGTAPVAISLLDADNNVLLPPEGLPTHIKFGTFTPITVDNFQTRSSFRIAVPREARFVRMEGIDWNTRTPTFTERPEIKFEDGDSLQTLRTFVDQNNDRPLVVIDTTAPPLGHETLSLRPNNLALEYSRLGWAVLFVPFGSTQEYPWIVNQHLAQVPRSELDDLLNYVLTTSSKSQRIYICSSFPSMENNARGERLKRNGWKYIYEIRDDMEEFNRVGYSKWYHPLLESRMIRMAHGVVTVSDALTRKVFSMSNGAVDAKTISNGVSETTLERSQELRTPAAMGVHESGGIIGYVGHLTSSWFDWNALLLSAKDLPTLQFEIVGHGMPDNLQLPENVSYLGPKTHDELLNIVSRWKVGLIPFLDSPLTRGVDPNKIYEYFSWGLRVVSAKMGRVHEYPATRVYSGQAELTLAIREMTDSPMTHAELQSIAEFAEDSSWRNRAFEMMQFVEGSPS